MYVCVCVGGRWIAGSFSSHRAVFVPMILWAFSSLTERGFFSQGSLGNEGLAVFTPRLMNAASSPSLSCVPSPHQGPPFLPALITQTPSPPCRFHGLLEIRRIHVIHNTCYTHSNIFHLRFTRNSHRLMNLLFLKAFRRIHKVSVFFYHSNPLN